MRSENRLRSRRDFDRVLQHGQRITRPEFVLYHFAREAPDSPRIGLSVGRQIGGAVVRNRVRRMLREAIRPLIPRLVACDVVVVVRPPLLGSGVEDLETAVAEAAARAGLIRT